MSYKSLCLEVVRLIDSGDSIISALAKVADEHALTQDQCILLQKSLMKNYLR